MNPQSLIAWWNLIFVVPFGLALVYLGLYTLTGVTFGDADADGDVGHDVDHDFEADADVDADMDADVDADLDADADVDTDAHLDADADAELDADAHVDADAVSDAAPVTDHGPDADADTSGHTPLHLAAMSFVGVGRVPLSVLLMVLLMTWGATGFVVNQLVTQRAGEGVGARAAAASVPAAALAALVFTRLVVRAIDRWLPLNETSARRRHDLLGRAGEAIFPIGKQFGLAAVRDDRGELYQVPCQLDPKREEPIAKGARVRLVAYSAKTKSFYVTAFDPGRGAEA